MHTQAYKFDPRLNNASSTKNLPESRNAGFRVGEKLVEDQVTEDLQQINLAQMAK